jgi:CDP-diacylglycerol--glycerol-3-phosphate 3-phosphatidyltransferase
MAASQKDRWTYTGLIGKVFGVAIHQIVRWLALSRIHPNILTFLGLVINIYAAYLFSVGRFRWAGAVIIGAGLFDMVDGRVARASGQVTRFGGFFDSVIDRYSDLALLMGLLVYYASISRPFYIVLTAIVMTGSVMISYARARAECTIPKCKVGFLERPERIVLLIIGALFDRMAAVLFVIAVLSNLTVIHRMIYTFKVCKQMEAGPEPDAAVLIPVKGPSGLPGSRGPYQVPTCE